MFKRNVLIVAVSAVCVGGLTVSAQGQSFTDFEGFTTGVSVNGQGGWKVTNVNGLIDDFDEEVVDDGTGNTAWRLSNAVTSANFPSQPFSPNSGVFAGETVTGATFNRFVGGFRFKSATGAPQPGLSVTVSASDGVDTGRQGFIDIEESSLATSGLDIKTFDVGPEGGFTAATIAAGLSYTDWHDFRLEIDFIDGEDNDVARYYVNGVLARTDTSWEEFYRNFEPLNSPTAVQSLIFRISGGAVVSVLGDGFLIDDVSVNVSAIPEPASLALLGLGGLAMFKRGTKRHG